MFWVASTLVKHKFPNSTILYICNIYRCMQKHSQHNNDERTHFFRKNIPLTLYSKWLRKCCERFMCERWVGQTATYWPPVPLSLSALLSRSAGLLNWWSWGPIALCWALVLSTAFSPTDSYSLNFLSHRVISFLTLTCFLWASHLHPIQPVHNQGYTLISSIGFTCSLIDLIYLCNFKSHLEWSNKRCVRSLTTKTQLTTWAWFGFFV